MKRITLLAGILGLAVFLSGCDKCGNFGPLFGLDTKSCGGKSANYGAAPPDPAGATSAWVEGARQRRRPTETRDG